MNGSKGGTPRESLPWLLRVVPALDSLRGYTIHTFRKDLFAGLTVAAVAVPQAMAYATIFGMPPQYGLYTAIVMTAVGAMLSSSKQLINGPTNAISIALLSALAVVPQDERISAAILMACLIGLIQTGITLLRLGDLSRYISHAVIVGFTAGASVLLVLDQMKNVFGLSAQGDYHDHFLKRFWLTMTEGGQVHTYTLAIAIGTIAMALLLRWVNRLLRLGLPELLLAIAAAGFVTYFWQLEASGVQLIQEVPRSLPHFQIPEWNWNRVQQLSGSAVAIAMLGLLEAIAMSNSISHRTKQKVDINQLCLSEGLANLTGSFFQCFPGSGSLTRSYINHQAGAATQWSGVICAGAVALTVLALAPLAQYIPRAALAGVLLLAATRMIDIAGIRYHFRATKFDAVIVSATALAAVLVSIAGWTLFRNTSRVGPVTSSSDYMQVTDLADSAVSPSLSPDGRMVTFKVGEDFFLRRGQIYVKLLPSGESVQLTRGQQGKYGPVFTPDGSRVAYTQLETTRDGLSWDTFTVPVLGGEPTRLLPNASGLTFLANRRVLFAEIRGGLHMGIVAATERRSEARDVYFPPHQLGMAHFAQASPDGQWILVVEMDQTHAFGLPCRLVPPDGRSAGREVGPRGTCTSAAWAPDGQWMYFGANVGGRSHLWRQRFPDGTPEQITMGPTEEEGVTVAPDGRSLITALGTRRSSIWLHDASGERAVVAEGYASLPRLSQDGTRLFFRLRPAADSDISELRALMLPTGAVQTVIPGVPIVDYDISGDESEVAFTTREGGESHIWIAPLNRRSPPRRIASQADQVSFGPGDDLIFRSIQTPANAVVRISRDGARRQQIDGPAVHDKGAVSADGRWVIVYSPGSGATAAVDAIGDGLRDPACFDHQLGQAGGESVRLAAEAAHALLAAAGGRGRGHRRPTPRSAQKNGRACRRTCAARSRRWRKTRRPTSTRPPPGRTTSFSANSRRAACRSTCRTRTPSLPPRNRCTRSSPRK